MLPSAKLDDMIWVDVFYKQLSRVNFLTNFTTQRVHDLYGRLPIGKRGEELDTEILANRDLSSIQKFLYFMAAHKERVSSIDTYSNAWLIALYILGSDYSLYRSYKDRELLEQWVCSYFKDDPHLLAKVVEDNLKCILTPVGQRSFIEMIGLYQRRIERAK